MDVICTSVNNSQSNDSLIESSPPRPSPPSPARFALSLDRTFPFFVVFLAAMEAAANDSRLGFGKMEFGYHSFPWLISCFPLFGFRFVWVKDLMTRRCKHYRRRCKIRAPCCNEIFYCRHCHNESTVTQSLSFFLDLISWPLSSLHGLFVVDWWVQSDRHELCRQDVQKVCSFFHIDLSDTRCVLIDKEMNGGWTDELGFGLICRLFVWSATPNNRCDIRFEISFSRA